MFRHLKALSAAKILELNSLAFANISCVGIGS